MRLNFILIWPTKERKDLFAVDSKANPADKRKTSSHPRNPKKEKDRIKKVLKTKALKTKTKEKICQIQRRDRRI